MSNKTLHWIFTGATALVGIVQYISPFIPPSAQGAVVGGIAGINALLHLFFPSGDPQPQAALGSNK